jgi:predicted Zn-dependent protease
MGRRRGRPGPARWSRRLAAGLVLWTFVLASCAVNPVTGKKELSLISEQGEIELGRETNAEITAQYGVYDPPGAGAYVAGVGKRIFPHSHRPNLPYAFQVLDTPVVNAFAAPGGFIYVTRGALALINTESELAVVLGHELGHVAARHTVRRMSEMIVLQVGLAVGSALSDTFAEIAGAAGIGVQLLYLKFSRDDERQADALGVEYARRAGFNPARMINFFATLQRLGDMSGGSSLPGFLSTHPLNSERIKNVSGMLTEADRSLAVRRDAYLQAVDNLVYGEDPRQGYVEGSVFYQPTLRFALTFPQGWKVQNTPSQVTLASADGQAAFVLEAEKTAEGLKAYAGRKSAEIKERELLNEASLTVNGLAAYEQLYRVPRQDKDPLRVRLSFVRKGEYVYTLGALSAAASFDAFDGPFRGILRSFREVRDAAHLNRGPRRLKIVKAPGDRTLQAIFEAAGMPKDSWAKAALLNGMQVTDKPVAGQWIKTIR